MAQLSVFEFHVVFNVNLDINFQFLNQRMHFLFSCIRAFVGQKTENEVSSIIRLSQNYQCTALSTINPNSREYTVHTK